jgi:hypothetical protein
MIAFEGNSNASAGWENSIWFFTDLVGAAAGPFNGDSVKMKPVPTDPKKFVSDEIKPSPTNPLGFKFGTCIKLDGF